MLGRTLLLIISSIILTGCGGVRNGPSLAAMDDQVDDISRRRRADVRALKRPATPEPTVRLASHSSSPSAFSFGLRQDEPLSDEPGDEHASEPYDDDYESFLDDDAIATTQSSERPGPLPGFWDTVKRDFKAMPDDLWRDTKKVYTSVPNLLILTATYGGSIALQTAGPDDKIERSFENQRIFSDCANDTFAALGNPGTHFALAGAWYLVGQQSQDDKTYNVGKKLFSALIINGLSTMVGKVATWDESPNGEWGTMPSGHTSSTFCFASVMHQEYGPLVGIPLYGLGTLVAMERLENEEHYFSDVVMGAVLGLVVGHTVAAEEELELFGGEIVPYADPITGSTGIAWVKHFK
jgi:hypothetical protein